MSDAGADIDTPSLRPIWKKAKDAAEKAAKPKESLKFDMLNKHTFNQDLGPDLENWFKSWPDLKKVTDKKEALDKTIAAYTKQIKTDKFDSSVSKPMLDALADISKKLDERLEKAKKAIAFNLEAGEKASKETPDIRPIRIFHGVDASKAVSAKLKAAKSFISIDRLDIEIILDDTSILKSVPSDKKEYVLLTQQMFDAANFDLITTEIAKALDGLIAYKDDLGKVKELGNKAIDLVLHDAADRASKPFNELTKARIDYKKYQFKKGLTMGMQAAGIAVGIAGIVTAPFSAGVHGVISIAALLRSARGLYVELDQAANSVEDQVKLVGEEVLKLSDKYKEADAGAIGAEEMSRALVNAFWPEATKTISTCKTHCSTLGAKVSGITEKAHKIAKELEEVLKKQDSVVKSLKEFDHSAKDKLDPPRLKAFRKLEEDNDNTTREIVKLFTSTAKVAKRAEVAQRNHALLQTAVDELVAKEPTWARVGEVLIKVAVSLGFIVGGSVGAPEGFDFVKEVHGGLEHAGQALDSADVAKELAGKLEKLWEATIKKAA